MARCFIYESGPESAAWRYRIAYAGFAPAAADHMESLLAYEVVLPRVQVRLQRAT